MNLNVNSLLIIGLGMIGSSIALSSKSKGIKVYGIDLKKSISDKALKKEIVDEIIESIDDIDSNKIDLIIISVPPKETLDLINQLEFLWNTNVTITETSSVKNHIKIENISNLILSHPIAGSDKSGLDAADKNLFLNKKNVVCDPFNADKDHLERV